MTTTSRAPLTAGGLLLALTALAVLVVPAPSAHADTTTTTVARVLRWADGDTVTTSKGKVRLIGIDTPERGTCGAGRTTRLAKRLAPVGSRVRLVHPAGVADVDRYGRLLRYVQRKGVDIGTRQVKLGAVARYDSRTGYDRHPLEARYIRLDARHALAGCSRAAFVAPTTSTSPTSATPGADGSCPSSAPIKGNRGSNGWIYHQPGQQYYGVTKAEECFATAAAAQAAGYRAAKV